MFKYIRHIPCKGGGLWAEENKWFKKAKNYCITQSDMTMDSLIAKKNTCNKDTLLLTRELDRKREHPNRLAESRLSLTCESVAADLRKAGS